MLKQGRKNKLFTGASLLWKMEQKKQIVLIVSFLLIVFGFLPLKYLSTAPPEAPEERQYKESAADKPAKPSPEKVAEAQRISVEKTVEENRKANNEGAGDFKETNIFIKDKRGLNAQEGVWRASNAVALYAFLQSLLTAFGIYLIFKTLIATKEALTHTAESLRVTQKALDVADETLREARKTTKAADDATQATLRSADAAESAERAYVYPVFTAKFKNINARGQDGNIPTNYKREIVLKIRVHNFGRTPAREGSITTVLWDPNVSSAGDGNGAMMKTLRVDKFDAIAAGARTKTIRSLELVTEDYLVPFDETSPHLVAEVKFTDAVGNKASDACIVNIRFHDKTGGPIPDDEIITLNSTEGRKRIENIRIYTNRKKQSNNG